MALKPDQNDSGGLWPTARAILINCMTLHDAFLSANPYFLSFPGFWPDAEIVPVSGAIYL
jgi:hypothetical protein